MATGMTAILAVMAATAFGFPRRWAVYRLLPLSDRSTAWLHRYVLALAVTWNFGFLTCQLLHFYGIDLALTAPTLRDLTERAAARQAELDAQLADANAWLASHRQRAELGQIGRAHV